MPRLSRREQRLARKRLQRRRLGAAGIAGIVVAGLVAAAAVGFGVHKVTSGGSDKTDRGQTTLLFSLAGSDGAAVESALLAHDSSTKQGVELLLPARVLTDVCGYGSQPLGRVLALPDGDRRARTAVSALLGGVTVDGSWTPTTAQLASLIDRLGGITADVDVDVTRRRSDGSRVLLVARGSDRHLNGAAAVAYASYGSATGNAAANLVRLQAVIDGVLAALPHDPGAVQRLVSSLGRSAASTLGAGRLADLLTGLAADERANAVFPTGLPVTAIDAGGPPSYRVDAQQVRQFVSGNLAASWPQSARGARSRVYVQNGVGTPGLVDSACTRLTAAGYAFAGSGNAAQFGYATSKVLVFDRSVASARLGDAVARTLRLPVGDVAVSSAGQNVADVLVILGKDYKP